MRDVAQKNINLSDFKRFSLSHRYSPDRILPELTAFLSIPDDIKYSLDFIFEIAHYRLYGEMEKTIMKERVKRKDFLDELEAMLPPVRVQRAKKEAEKEIFRIRLSELRKQMGVKQEDIRAFTQSGISKLESRKDMKISTLVEYLQNIGMGLEIKAYPKKRKHKADEVVLLKM
jgi:hypothetical protein